MHEYNQQLRQHILEPSTFISVLHNLKVSILQPRWLYYSKNHLLFYSEKQLLRFKTFAINNNLRSIPSLPSNFTPTSTTTNSPAIYQPSPFYTPLEAEIIVGKRMFRSSKIENQESTFRSPFLLVYPAVYIQEDSIGRKLCCSRFCSPNRLESNPCGRAEGGMAGFENPRKHNWVLRAFLFRNA